MNEAARMALVSLAIEPKTADDRERLVDAIQRLTAEDPGCSLRTGPVSGQMLIGASSEQHLDVIVDRLRRGVRKAEPVLLEPVMRVEAVVPARCLTEVVEDLVSRGGQVQSRRESGDMHTVRALVPLVNLFGYTTVLRSRTEGRGTCSIHFEVYMPVRMPDDGPDSMVGVPRKPAPWFRDSGVALPEPDDHRAGE